MQGLYIITSGNEIQVLLVKTGTFILSLNE